MPIQAHTMPKAVQDAHDRHEREVRDGYREILAVTDATLRGLRDPDAAMREIRRIARRQLGPGL